MELCVVFEIPNSDLAFLFKLPTQQLDGRSHSNAATMTREVIES